MRAALCNYSILTAAGDGIADVTLDTLADASVTGGSAKGVGSAGPLDAGVAAGVVAELAVGRVRAVIVHHALQVWRADAVGSEVHTGGTDALLAVRTGHQAAGAVADAAAAQQDETELGGTADTHALTVLVVARWADTFLPLVQYEATTGWASRYWGALDGSVALVAGDADAHHGADRKGVQHGALGVPAARVRHPAWVDALLVDTSRLTGTLLVRSAPDLCPAAAGALVSDEAGRAAAVHLVVNHDTFGRLATGVLDSAGGDAVVVVAGQLGRAVPVRSALNTGAGHPRVSL